MSLTKTFHEEFIPAFAAVAYRPYFTACPAAPPSPPPPANPQPTPPAPPGPPPQEYPVTEFTTKPGYDLYCFVYALGASGDQSSGYANVVAYSTLCFPAKWTLPSGVDIPGLQQVKQLYMHYGFECDKSIDPNCDCQQRVQGCVHGQFVNIGSDPADLFIKPYCDGPAVTWCDGPPQS